MLIKAGSRIWSCKMLTVAKGWLLGTSDGLGLSQMGRIMNSITSVSRTDMTIHAGRMCVHLWAAENFTVEFLSNWLAHVEYISLGVHFRQRYFRHCISVTHSSKNRTLTAKRLLFVSLCLFLSFCFSPVMKRVGFPGYFLKLKFHAHNLVTQVSSLWKLRNAFYVIIAMLNGIFEDRYIEFAEGSRRVL